MELPTTSGTSLSREPNLEAECAALCRRIFAMPPPPGCVEAYRRANAVVFDSAVADAHTMALIAEAVRRDWDLEAIEYALRFRDRTNPLTKKVNILFYIIEASPVGARIFVNDTPAVWRAWISLTAETLRSINKLLKGFLLLQRLAKADRRLGHA